MMRNTSLILLSAAAGAALTVMTVQPRIVFDRSSAEAAAADAYKQLIPPELRNRELHDGLVVEALENWASSEAARILDGVFLATAAVTLIAIPSALALGDRPRMLARDDSDARDAAGITLAG